MKGGYACRFPRGKTFGRGFDSRRLHHSTRSLRSLAHGALGELFAWGRIEGHHGPNPQATEENGALSDQSSGGKSKGTSSRQTRPYFVYILRCADGTLYTGCAKDPRARAQLHNTARGARYTAGRRPVTLVYSEECASLGSALRREHQLKRWTRARKEALVAGDLDPLKQL